VAVKNQFGTSSTTLAQTNVDPGSEDLAIPDKFDKVHDKANQSPNGDGRRKAKLIPIYLRDVCLEGPRQRSATKIRANRQIGRQRAGSPIVWVGFPHKNRARLGRRKITVSGLTARLRLESCFGDMCKLRLPDYSAPSASVSRARMEGAGLER